LVLVTLCAGYVASHAQETAQGQRSFTVTASKYAFAPVRLEVAQDDLVKVTMTSADIAHSFTIDAYRIDSASGRSKPSPSSFRATQTGTFKNLLQADAGRALQGHARRARRQQAAVIGPARTTPDDHRASASKSRLMARTPRGCQPIGPSPMPTICTLSSIARWPA
jgi:hypothetical protein